jgi:hypothetical protein
MNPSKAKVNLNNIVGFSPYGAVNTLLLGYKTNQLLPYRKIAAISSEIHRKHTIALWRQNVECVNFNPGAT